VFEAARARIAELLKLQPRRGRATFWLLGAFIVLWPARWIPGLGGLATALEILTGLALLLVAVPLAWFLVRTRLLWSLRNRLILTYVLFGLAPVVLLGTLVIVSGYVAAGQFAIHLVDTRIQTELNQMAAENDSRMAQLSHLVEGRPMRDAMLAQMPPEERMAITEARRARLKRATTCFLEGTSIFQASPERRVPLGLPSWARDLPGGTFRGIVQDGSDLYLVAIEQQRLNDGRRFSVVRSLLMDGAVVDMLAQGLGAVSFSQVGQQDDDTTGRKRLGAEISGGTVPPAVDVADMRVSFLSTLGITDWSQGRADKADNVAVEVSSRRSLLYQQLFAASLSGRVMDVIRVSLFLLAVLFAGIEIMAFLMASRLSRTITNSVADLYDATLRVDRGDLQHRIYVTQDDQMAELSRSFNRMIGSLQRALVEQKEKERLQNELSIAQEVQANLFPRHAVDLPTLELHGVCRPARSVSGDYYDFLVFHEDVPSASGARPGRREAGVGIAIGDISGKGISAALLMATLHSAVRAYQFASEELLYSASMVDGLLASKEGLADAGGWFQSPGRIMSLLNRHLYRSTQPEKYATLFLAHYNAASSVLTYSNAGQLPPFVLGRDGSVRRLEEGGTVVGLMDGMHFDEGRVVMQVGDIFIGYSDGVTEPENDFGDFGEERLLEVVSRYRTQPLHVISAQVMLALDAWIGAEEQPDDITLVLARQR
jgi:sigma-B regulation protein RsbU (phosphoserine phosphatase)